MDLDESLDILGLNKKCRPEEVKQAFRCLSRVYHADRYTGKDADEKFRNIHSAYQVALEYARLQGKNGEKPSSKLKTEEQVFIQWMARFQKEMDSSKFDAAMESLDKLHVLRPDNNEVLFEKFKLLVNTINSGNITDKKRNVSIKELLTTADKLIENLPASDFKNRGYVYNEVGVLYAGIGQDRKALQYYSKSVKEYKGEPANFINFATMLYKLEMIDDARDVFSRFFDEFPQESLHLLEELCENNKKNAFYASLYAKALDDNGYKYIASKWRKRAKYLNRRYGGAIVLK